MWNTLINKSFFERILWEWYGRALGNQDRVDSPDIDTMLLFFRPDTINQENLAHI